MVKAKILIVDDTEVSLKVYAKEFEKTEHEVFCALTWLEAVDIAKTEALDIVFTDLVVPEMNGVEICKRMKELDPKIEAVLISAYSEGAAQYEKDFIAAGGRKGWLKKPLKPGKLLEITEEILSERNK